MQSRFEQLTKQRLAAALEVHDAIYRQINLIVEAARHLVEAYRHGGMLLVFGNGGSAADAQHIAAELVGKYLLERAPLPAVALTTNSSIISAVGNDYGFSHVFARQVLAFGDRRNVALGISTSGDSENVVEGLRAARSCGMRTLGLTGESGGQLVDIADICIRIASPQTPRIQEGHILVGHILCELVEEELFGGQ